MTCQIKGLSPAASLDHKVALGLTIHRPVHPRAHAVRLLYQSTRVPTCSVLGMRQAYETEVTWSRSAVCGEWLWNPKPSWARFSAVGYA